MWEISSTLIHPVYLTSYPRSPLYSYSIHQNATPVPGAPIATIGAGTGLGECFLTPGDGGHYVAYPSEGGHAEFPPRTETEVSRLAGETELR